MKSINLLFIEDNIDPTTGGVERVSWALANYLEAFGIHSYFSYAGYDFDKISNGRKIQLNFYKDDQSELLNKLSDFVAQNYISIIIVQNIATDKIRYCFRKLKEKSNIKIIYCFHRNPVSSKLSSISRYYRLKVAVYNLLHGIKPRYPFAEIVEDVDKYVLLSPSYIPSFTKLYHVKDTDKFMAMQNPVPFAFEEPDLDIKEKTVLIIARFEEQQKNIKKALDVWNKFEQKNSDWQLLIGGYGEDYEDVLNYSKRYDLKRCKFLGKIENPKELYKHASIYMMTSRYEGYPMTLLEAMEFGCVPIVYNTFTSLQDIVEDGKNGLIVKPYSVDKYVNALLDLVNNQEKRKQMAIAAYEKVRTSNTIEAIGNQWVEFLNAISE